MARWKWTVVAATALTLALAACSAPAGPSDLFREANAWTDEPPAGAQQVSPDEFRRMVGDGRLVLRSTKAVTEGARALDAAFETDRAFLAGLAERSVAVDDLLAATATLSGFQPDVAVELDGRTVSLDGPATQLANAVRTVELAASVDNALAAYRLAYELLPTALQPRAATPASLSGRQLADVVAAADLLDALLDTLVDLDRAAWEDAPVAPGSPALTVQNAGNGDDTGKLCTGPTGFVSRLWFPLKSFLPPVRDQGSRSTCWAFTAVGAVESRELVQNDFVSNLSEQYLVNKVKHDWAESDYHEGYSALAGINLANAKGARLPYESAWTYNPSPSRADPDGHTAAAYRGTCDGYSGWCSETAHQSPVYCTTVVLVRYCGYATVNITGGSVPTGTARQVWSAGEGFKLSTFRFLLDEGHVLMASFPVYEGFMRAPAGVVSDYSKKYRNKDGALVDGSYGGHAAQVVAFFSNSELSTPGHQYNVGGGGYFVIKNSWGCGAGDGGYYYVPADYVASRFSALYTLDFGTDRSRAWRDEQANPGGKEPPTVAVLDPMPTVDLRVQTDLTTSFAVSHPVATSVALTVTSNVDGTLFNGPWNTAPYVFRTPLTHTFTSTGPRTITVRAGYAGKVTQRSFVATVVNTPPTLSVTGSGTAYRAEPYTLTAVVSDLNDPGTAALCANTTWSVTAPDTLSATTGCQVNVTFGAEGNRSVNVQTRDSDGATTSRTFTTNVQSPPVNPYPRVLGGGMYARRLSPIGQVYLCLHSGVAAGATIDFRATGCNFIGETGAHPLNWAYVDVENPDGATLTYDWRVYANAGVGGAEQLINSALGSTAALFAPYSPGNAVTITVPCRITVRVNAPDPARSKTLTAWSGSCTYDSTRIN